VAANEFQLVEDFLRGHEPTVRLVDEWLVVVLRGYEHSLGAEHEDLSQEVRIRVLRNLGRGIFNGQSTLRTYVHRIAKNVCIDAIREKARRRRLEVADASLAETTARESSPAAVWIARDLVAKILSVFSDDDRALLTMVFVEHRSYSEIASSLSIPEGTVKSRMFRCKNRLYARRKELMRMNKKEYSQ